MKQTTIAAGDGYLLAAHTYGDARAARAGVLIVPAMGVEQQCYARFAHWLAARGCFVVTFDYRGMGHSRRGTLRGLDADVLTWAEQDTGAALAFLRLQVDRRPLLWFVRVPLTTRLFGYFPGRLLRVIGDVPAGVMRQWRSWCLDADYLFGVLPSRVRAHCATLRLPLLSLSFTDDEYLSQRNIESLHGFYSAAEREMQRLAPQDVGVSGIGHFGFFRKRYEDTLWPRVGEWLDRRVERIA